MVGVAANLRTGQPRYSVWIFIRV